MTVKIINFFLYWFVSQAKSDIQKRYLSKGPDSENINFRQQTLFIFVRPISEILRFYLQIYKSLIVNTGKKFGVYKQNHMTEALYSDPQVTIYKELIQINKYYFPLATSRTIMISDIESVVLNDAKGIDHRWGVHPDHVNNWFPLDTERLFKPKYIEIIIKNKTIRPCITPDYPDACFEIIWENFTEAGKKFVEEVVQHQHEKAVEDELKLHEEMKKALEEEAKQKKEAPSKTQVVKPSHEDEVKMHADMKKDIEEKREETLKKEEILPESVPVAEVKQV